MLVGATVAWVLDGAVMVDATLVDVAATEEPIEIVAVALVLVVGLSTTICEDPTAVLAFLAGGGWLLDLA